MAAELTPPKKATPRRRYRFYRGHLGGARKWWVAALFALPLAIILLKLSNLPIAEPLRHLLSLQGSADVVKSRVAHVLLVPLGAAIVVFFRVTLGIRVLGPFRSVLLAIAFQITGVLVGCFFLALVVATLVSVRPLLKKIKLPYFARLSVSLSTVATLIMVAMVLGRALDWHALARTAYFPVVVLCLTADGFASTLRREGLRSALWRGAATAAVAVLITAIAAIPGFELTLARYPELLLVETGCIILIAECLGLRLFSHLNPPVPKKKKSSKKKSKKTSTAPAAVPESGSVLVLPIRSGLAEANAPVAHE